MQAAWLKQGRHALAAVRYLNGHIIQPAQEVSIDCILRHALPEHAASPQHGNLLGQCKHCVEVMRHHDAGTLLFMN